MSLDPFYLPHVERGQREIACFWPRLGGKPSFRGLKVLDLGCGLGGLCLDVAGGGARQVVGIEIEQALVEFADAHAAQKFPQFRDTVRFRCCPVADLDEDDFDAIVSKDVLEHVQDLESVFAEMTRRLKPGGRMYLGFGPLWYSPFGGHGINTAVFPWSRGMPWAHLLFPESFLMRRVNRTRKTPVGSIREYGLNRRPFKEYVKLLQDSGLDIRLFHVNPTNNPIGRAFSFLRHVPLAGELFTRTVYCILEKRR